MTPKTQEHIDSIMERIPPDSRYRWCGGERGACACLGCVQVWNRAVMYEEIMGRPFTGDPERLDEGTLRGYSKVWNAFKVTKEEHAAWCTRNPRSESGA